MGGAGLVVGLATYGYKIMRVLGVKMVSAALCGGVRRCAPQYFTKGAVEERMSSHRLNSTICPKNSKLSVSLFRFALPCRSSSPTPAASLLRCELGWLQAGWVVGVFYLRRAGSIVQSGPPPALQTNRFHRLPLCRSSAAIVIIGSRYGLPLVSSAAEAALCMRQGDGPRSSRAALLLLGGPAAVALPSPWLTKLAAAPLCSLCSPPPTPWLAL